MATPAKSVGFYVPLPEAPNFEATYEDLECCLLGVRRVLMTLLMGGIPIRIDGTWQTRPRRTECEQRRKLIAQTIAAIDKAHPPDNSETMPQLRAITK